MTVMKAAALDYARQGWRVIPIWWLGDEDGGRRLCGCGNPFCEAAGKHPLIKLGRGMAAASSEAAEVAAWWDRWPRANVAVATGSLSGIVVVDLDVHGDQDGEVELGAWCAGQGFEPPETLKQETGSGGRHLVYAAPDDGGPAIRNCTAWLEGVDVRGEGGYILVAPSTHETGGQYRWLNGLAIAGLGPLLGALRTARGKPGGGGGGDQPAYDYREACRTGPPPGTRDAFFNSRAFELRKQDVPYDDAKRELRRVWELTPQPGGNEFAWEAVIGKLDRVWAEVEPEPLPSWDPLAQAALPLAGSPRGKDTDLGNAQRFADAKTGRVLHTQEAGWYVWSGRHWQEDGRGLITQEASDVVEGIYTEALAVTDPDKRDGLLLWAKKSEAAARIRSMLELAAGHDPLAGSVLDFNPDPWLMNVGNGVIDLRTGKLGPHDPGLLISRLSEVEYDPEAEDPRWDAYVKSVTGGDDELARYLQRAAGYSLTASTLEEVLFILYGPKNSGKSTFADALQACLGDMAMLTQPETLMHQRGSQAPKDELARMLDKRVVVTIEMPDGGRFAESLVKQLTGGDKVAARNLYKSGFEYRPVFKIWVATNHAPKAYDDAIWRRIKRIPFPRSVPEEEQDRRLKPELQVPRTNLARTFLAWAVRGCMTWQAEGLGSCAAVELDTEEYREEQDKFGRFLDEECVLGSVDPAVREVMTTGRDLYARYSAWAEREGERPMQGTAFSLKLKERGFEKVISVRPIAWRGIALRIAEVNAWGL